MLDAAWFKSLANVITAGISFVVAVRTYQVFPFDFSTYSHDWSWLVRVILIAVMVGTAIGFTVELIRLVTWPLPRPRDSGMGLASRPGSPWSG